MGEANDCWLPDSLQIQMKRTAWSRRLRSCRTELCAGLTEWIKSASDGKGATGFSVTRLCGIYPAKRIVRRQTLDLKRVKEPTYFNEIYTQQFRIEPDKYSIEDR